MSTNFRPLSTFERLLWLHDQAEPTHFSVSGLIEGATTVEEWKMALALLQRRHPLLRVSIQTDGKGVPFFQEEERTRIPLRVVEWNAEDQLEQEVARELATPFSSAATAPLIRATVVHAEKRSLVILAAHHSIADGISLAYAIRDLLHALGGKPLEQLPVPPSHEDLLGLAEDPAESATSGVKGSINPQFFRLVPRVASMLLSRKRTADLRERAQLEGTSVHGALLASIVFAARELGVVRDRAVNLASPISTRKALRQADTCTMLTDIGIQDASVPESGDFWELARNIRNDLAPQASLGRIAGARVEFRRMFADAHDGESIVQMVRGHMHPDFTLSNLGDPGLETQAGKLRLAAVWGPSILMGCREDQQFLGAATANGRLSLLYSSYSPIPRLLEAIENTLAEQAEAPTRVAGPHLVVSPAVTERSVNP
jgi:Condensation domain